MKSFVRKISNSHLYSTNITHYCSFYDYSENRIDLDFPIYSDNVDVMNKRTPERKVYFSFKKNTSLSVDTSV